MDYYGLSASGVLLDVLRWRKPVVAFDTPVVRELAERFGDIGYICADEDEMAAVVQRLLAGHDPQRYQAQRRNLDAAYRSRLPDAAALEYRGMRQACWNPTLKMA
jgi:glycosyltransferase involved in cell wall biosynthesis